MAEVCLRLLRGVRYSRAVRHVILNADDFGYDPSVSRGIAEAMRHGLVSSTTMIVNAPSSEAAARDSAGLAIGLHLNLVCFNALSTGAPLDKASVATLTADFVEEETLAQLARLEALLGRPATHIDTHHHSHLEPAVLSGLLRVAARRALPVRSINPAMRTSIRAGGVHTNDAFVGAAEGSAYWTLEEWLRQLDALPADGLIELMCHPGYSPSQVQSRYSSQREVELRTFTSAAARTALAYRQLTLESWRSA
jgi:chitin disaccharide deacetylase